MQRVKLFGVGVFGLWLCGACEPPEYDDALTEDDEPSFRDGEEEAIDPDAGWYRIHTRYNGECLDVVGNSGNAGAHIINWPCHYGNNQRVKFEPAGDGWYRIKFKHSGLYLAVPGGSDEPGWRLVQWQATGGDEQLFRLDPQADGTFRIFTRNDMPLSLLSHGTDYGVYDDSDDFLAQYEGDPGELFPSGDDFVRSFFWADLIQPAEPWPNWSSILSDWGYSDRRWMVDFNGDGKADYCRAVGETSGPQSWLGCTFSNGSTFTKSIDIWAPVGDWGHANRRWMVDFNGDGKSDYCRATGASSGPGSFLTCSLSNGSEFSSTVSAPISDWGYADRRWMADVNGDGKADFCRAVGESSGGFSWLGCAFSTGTGFNNDIDVWFPMPDWGGPADRRFMADVNGDGRVDFGHASGVELNRMVFELL